MSKEANPVPLPERGPKRLRRWAWIVLIFGVVSLLAGLDRFYNRHNPHPTNAHIRSTDLRNVTVHQAIETSSSNTTLAEIDDRAEAGDPEARYALGLRYERGEGTAQDYAKALEWYHRAADQDFPKAQNKLGNIYSGEKAGAPDYEQALLWYRKAADHRYPEALANLGRMYEAGLGVAQDKAEALRWYLAASEKGHAFSNNYVGAAYEKGELVEQDYKKAAEHYRAAALQGDAFAQSNLANLYFEGLGVVESLLEAGHWYAMAAQSGHEQTQAYLARQRWECSQNVRPDGSIIYDMPACFIAAGTNDPAAVHAVAMAFWNGKSGVLQDSEKAVEWMRRAARLNSPGAQVHLGVIYDKGELVPQDLVESCAWFLVADDHPNLNELQRDVVDISIRYCRRHLHFFDERKARKRAKAYADTITSTRKVRQRAAAYLETKKPNNNQ